MSSSTLPRRRRTEPPENPPMPKPAGRTGPLPVRRSLQRAASSAEAVRAAGRYRYDRHGGSWWWSPETFAALGLPPDGARPCTELLLEHLHPDDRSRALEALTDACSAGRPFALEVRLQRPDGVQRTGVLLGESECDAGGATTAVEGLLADVTAGRPPGDATARAAALETEVEQLRTAMASRATIEQAKGILMLLTGRGEQVAFELLTHMSSHTHRKVRDVAQTITASAAGRTPLPDDLRAILRDACPPAPRAH